MDFEQWNYVQLWLPVCSLFRIRFASSHNVWPTVRYFILSQTWNWGTRPGLRQDRKVNCGLYGGAENAGVEKSARSKLQGWKMQEWDLREDMCLKDLNICL